MAASSRTAQFGKIFKVLKKHYQPATLQTNRPVLEHLIFACCAENSHYDAAEEAFATLVHSFFDFNEIRVSSVRELSEVMAALENPPAAANRVKRVLHSVFESTYSFDLESLRKLNLGPASDKLRKLDGATHFSVAYVIQIALGGHAIPVDLGALRALEVLSLVSEKDVKAGAVPGLGRAIAKSKGLEFACLLHALGADFIANPYAPALHGILQEIDPEARQRLPKRRSKKQAEAAAVRQEKQEEARSTGHTPHKSEVDVEQPDSQGKKKRPGSKKKASSAASKKATPPKKQSTARRSDAAEDGGSGAGKKGSASSGLSKRKPR